ncbi:MAG: M15 family peptidase, partial [Chloroflexales bacterium]
MSDDVVELETVGDPEKAGATREGKAVELIVLADTRSAGDDLAEGPPNYHVDQFGTIRQVVDEGRAGGALGLAIYKQRRHNIDRIGISVLLQRPDEGDYSDDQLRALSRLLADISARRRLGDSALARLSPAADGKLRVTPALPPPPPVVSGDDLLGAAPLSPEQELWLFLYGETYKPRGGTLKIGQALPLQAAKFGLGAPLGPNDATTTVAAEGHTYSVQPFATDLIFYEGTQYAAVRSLNAIFEEGVAEIPATGTGRALLEASYNLSIATTEKRTGALAHTKTLQPGWRFHLVAKNGHLGPAISDNYIFTADQQYAFQIFGADTLYTPMSDQTGCEHLNLTDPAFPALNALWGETYRFQGVPFDPNSPWHKKAVELRIGVPLTSTYTVALGATTYALQVWTLDTLYAGPDGQIKRMKDLPMTAEAQAWTPAQPTNVSRKTRFRLHKRPYDFCRERRDDGVSVGAQSSHSVGYPMSQ